MSDGLGIVLPQIIPAMPMIASFYYDSTLVFGGRDTGTGSIDIGQPTLINLTKWGIPT